MRLALLLAFASLVAGCGSSGGGGSTAANPRAPAPKQSPGGIWHAFGGPSDAISMFIAETGELMVQSAGPAFGSGAVIVNGTNEVAGTYRLKTLQTSPGAAPPIQTCEIEGTVTERVSLQLDIHCSDGAGTVSDRTVGLAYNPAYDTDSSLAEIAGNYTLSFNPQTNILNINGSGVIFGMINNAANCTLNGQVEIIDARFNLYRFEVVFSLCQAPLVQYEGATMTGLGAPSLPGMPDGAFLLMITGTVTGVPFDFFSLLYEPV